MKRRDFLRQSAAGAAALSVMRQAFASPAEAQTTTKVALVKTQDRAAGILTAMKLLSFPPPKGKTVAPTATRSSRSWPRAEAGRAPCRDPVILSLF